MSKKKIITAVAASAVAALFAVLLYAVVFGNQGFLEMYRKDAAGAKEVAAAQAVIDSLKREIELLKNDTAYIEKIAREKLGMARKGEVIYKFVEDAP